MRLPEGTDLEKLEFYYGAYGSAESASDIIDLRKNQKENTITGILKEDLPMGSGITCFSGQVQKGICGGKRETRNLIISLGSACDFAGSTGCPVSVFWKG